jgi:hypothetical protein
MAHRLDKHSSKETCVDYPNFHMETTPLGITLALSRLAIARAISSPVGIRTLPASFFATTSIHAKHELKTHLLSVWIIASGLPCERKS